jgi:hypothetical protein
VKRTNGAHAFNHITVLRVPYDDYGPKLELGTESQQEHIPRMEQWLHAPTVGGQGQIPPGWHVVGKCDPLRARLLPELASRSGSHGEIGPRRVARFDT